MKTITDYHDGTSSNKQKVELVFNDNASITLNIAGYKKVYFLNEINFSSRLGNTPRVLKLPNNAACHIQDNNLVDEFLNKHKQQVTSGFIHFLENHITSSLSAVVFTLLFSWSMFMYGVPYLSKQIAYNLPSDISASLGRGTLETMDTVFFTASELDENVRSQLLQRFEAMKSTIDNGHHYKIEFRHSDKIGANAFALPSGIIVITDELVNLSQNNDEVVSIIAHELGHLVHRHSLRMVLQDSAIAVLIATITGDPFSSSSLIVALPTLLANARYSREFEAEADDYAYQYMTNNNMKTVVFANILERITEDEANADDALENYFSSHPGTASRLQRFR